MTILFIMVIILITVMSVEKEGERGLALVPGLRSGVNTD